METRLDPPSVGADARAFHSRVDPHRHASRLSQLILGGQDGLVNTLGVLLGVAAATRDVRLVFAAGLAATFAEAVSMAAVAYTSTEADRSLYESELAREHRHVRAVPELEAEEIRDIYRRKGLSGKLLDQVVATITASQEVWVAVMMAEELKLAPVARSAALRACLRVGFAALVGSAIPLLPFVLLPVRTAMWTAVGVSALALFLFGAYQARTTIGNWLRGGLQLTLIGVASAFVGYLAGRLFQVR